jgi:hypothetical protein
MEVEARGERLRGAVGIFNGNRAPMDRRPAVAADGPKADRLLGPYFDGVIDENRLQFAVRGAARNGTLFGLLQPRGSETVW